MASFSLISFGRWSCLCLGMFAALTQTPERLLAQEFAAVAPGTFAPPAYEPEVDYPLGAVVRGADGNLYRALQAVTGQDPSVADGAAWRLARVEQSLTLDVPGRFSTVADAMTFVADAPITTTATVTIQLAPKAYSCDSTLRLDHPDGSRIVIDGGRRPNDCTLSFTDSDGIEVRQGSGISLRQLTLVARTTKANPAHVGIRVADAAGVRLEHCRIEGFWQGVEAVDGGRVSAKNCTVESSVARHATSAFAARRNGLISLQDCQATYKGKDKETYTSGFLAVQGGLLTAEGCSASDWSEGFHAGRGGTMGLKACKATGGVHGLTVFAATGTADDCTFSNNKLGGVNVHGSSVVLSGCTLSHNAVGCSSLANSTVDFRDTPSRITDNTWTGLQSVGGGAFWGLKPAFGANRTELEVIPKSTSSDALVKWED